MIQLLLYYKNILLLCMVFEELYNRRGKLKHRVCFPRTSLKYIVHIQNRPINHMPKMK